MIRTRKESNDRIKFYNNWCKQMGIKGSSEGYVNFCNRVDKLESK